MQKTDNKTAVIILAAGLGTRMRSDMAKVLHKVCGKTMINHVVDTALKIADANIIVVTGYQSDQVRECVKKDTGIKFAIQEQQLGTGHAVLCALPELKDDIENVLILCGDVPLLTHITLSNFIRHHKGLENIITVLAVEVDDPTGYGRMIVDGHGNLVKIVEQADANLKEKEIKTINAGIYCVERKFLEHSLNMLKPDNSQNELYLTDIISIAATENCKVGLFVGNDADEVIGVNSVQDLYQAEQLLQNRQGKTS